MGKFLKTIVLALGLVSSLNAFADAKSDLQDLLKNINALRADSVQEVSAQDGKLLYQTEGYMQMQKPLRVLLHNVKPESTVLFSHGDNICYYDPFVNQVTVMQQGILYSTPFALLIAQDPKVWDQYEVSGSLSNFNLKLKEPRDLISLNIYFNEDKVIEKIALHMKDGTTNLYTLSNVRPNVVEVDFTVKIPSDAEIDYGR